MGLCIRVFVLIFLLIFTACAVCSSLFAQFYVKKGSEAAYMYLLNIGNYSYTPENVKVDYWRITGDTPSAITAAFSNYNLSSYPNLFPKKLSTPTSDAFGSCNDRKTYFLASGALAIAGAAFGGLATLLAAGHMCTSANCCLACSILLFCLVAFACMGVSFALMVAVYMKSICGNKIQTTADLREGFALSVAACGGFLITAFFELCA